jgi:hypothetical protein
MDRITIMKTKRRTGAVTGSGPVPIQRRMAVMRPEPEGECAIRVSHRAGRKRGTGRILPRYLIQCGCCDARFEIYHGDEELEINGVNGTLANWRQILLPLLQVVPNRQHRANGKVKKLP